MNETLEFPTLVIDRLIPRPFVLGDAADVQQLAGAIEVASTTLNIPHPYPDGLAEAWIESQQGAHERGEGATCAITLRESGALVGAISLGITAAHERAELGYWIGVPYWNQGYCTEAARAVVRYGFRVLGLRRISAYHFARNPASGRVMQKIGMTHEGTLRQHIKKWGAFEDLICYGLTRDAYETKPGQCPVP